MLTRRFESNLSRRRMRCILLAVALVLVSVIVLATGCTGGSRVKHEYTLAPGQAHHPGLAKALLIPMNENLERISGLDVADKTLMDLTARLLADHGVTVTRIDQSAYQLAEKQALKAARDKILSGESGSVSQDVSFSDVLPPLLAEIDSDAQLIVMPNVVMRTGKYTGGSMVKWDGVKRRERGARQVSMSGTPPAASFLAMIYRSDGTRLFSGYGGLDLVYELNVPKEKYEIRDDLLQDVENLAEGVCVAFHPFFGENVSCRDFERRAADQAGQ